ncbi:hypothetical protein ACTNB0_10575 [Lachnospiraceae bacterium HCP28S3_F9]|mgnify:FL=1|uniref:hypothetical protein n=1 Tax=Faecalicatena contorta TaxID=39482 RepID=UPI0031DC7F4E
MGWLIAAVAVFVILVFIVSLSLCMAAGDEDDDAEQMKWIQDIEEKRRKRNDDSNLH